MKKNESMGMAAVCFLVIDKLKKKNHSHEFNICIMNPLGIWSDRHVQVLLSDYNI